jgi:hypothetical protein
LVNVKAKKSGGPTSGQKQITSTMALSNSRLITTQGNNFKSPNSILNSRKSSVGKSSSSQMGITKIKAGIQNNLDKIKENAVIEEKDSFDHLNFSTDSNLVGININAAKDLENRLTSTLEGITTTFNLLTGVTCSKNFDYSTL